MQINSLISVIVLNITLTSGMLNAQNISVQASEYIGTDVIFGCYYGNMLSVISKTKTTDRGLAVFQNEQLKSGVYYILINDSIFCDFLIDEQYPGKISFSYSTDSGFALLMSPEPTRLNEIYKKQGQLPDYSEYPATSFTSVYFKALERIKIPNRDFPPDTPDIDSARIYFNIHYFRQHYLDNIDFSDQRLINTPVITDAIYKYLFTVTSQIPDSLVKSVNYIYSLSVKDSICQNHVINYLLEELEKKKNDAVYEYAYLKLIEKFILNNSRVELSSAKKELLINDYNIRKNVSLFQSPVELILSSTDNEKKTIFEQKGEFTLIYFFDYGCEICEQIISQLNNKLNKYSYLDISRVSICLGNSDILWKEYLQKHKMQNWDNFIAQEQLGTIIRSYNIEYTPTLFLLNDKQKIAAKNITVSELDKILYDYVTNNWNKK